MLSKIFLFFLLFSLHLQMIVTPDRNITIYSIGNQNMTDFPLNSGRRGWMQMMPMFFDQDIRFKNYAVENVTASGFLEGGYWRDVENQIKPGDYVFISFVKRMQSGVDDETTYENSISKFITEAREKKAIPILFPPVASRKNRDDVISLIKRISEKEHVLVIEMGAGVDENMSSPGPGLDAHHAIVIAKEMAYAIQEKIPDLRRATDADGRQGASYPAVLTGKTADIIPLLLKSEAAKDFNLRRLPSTKKQWEIQRQKIKNDFIKYAGITIDHTLPLDVRETGSVKMGGYTIKKIYFQTRPGVYATANLYVPDGKGPFPAIINMHGHWPNGKAGDMVQSCAHELALNGYVCLNIDAWGAGERTTIHGTDEYHGSNLGASLLNIGESLLGNQVTDNMRGVDLLSSLSYVDKNNIGATGASGGGNQTMWLSALDERIKASMPVVSVGTFQSYIMGSNCVCELMPEGLTTSEESGVLALMAPRAVKICSALQDANPAFFPSEMIRSYTNARPVFALYQKTDNVQYQLFNTPHGYWPEMRQAMLGWFDLKLKGKGNGDFKKEVPFKLLSNDQLMVFPKGKRDPLVTNTSDYCIRTGHQLLKNLYNTRLINTKEKRDDLRRMLLLPDKPDAISEVHDMGMAGRWQKLMLETSRRHLIPLRYMASGNDNKRTVIFFTGGGENNDEDIRSYISRGFSIFLADVWGTGELRSEQARMVDGRLPEFHTLARSELWLGHTIMGEWVSDIHNVIQFVNRRADSSSVTIVAQKEISIAALIQSALNNDVDTCILKTSPVSYALDKREGIDFFNMSVHLPGILKWGDISLMAALTTHSQIIFDHPVTITGQKITGELKEQNEINFSTMLSLCGSESNIIFRE